MPIGRSRLAPLFALVPGRGDLSLLRNTDHSAIGRRQLAVVLDYDPAIRARETASISRTDSKILRADVTHSHPNVAPRRIGTLSS
jgi:hypothetical protein